MTFTASLSVADHYATIEISGELDSASAPRLHQIIEQALQPDVTRLELHAMSLTYMSSACARCCSPGRSWARTAWWCWSARRNR